MFTKKSKIVIFIVVLCIFCLFFIYSKMFAGGADYYISVDSYIKDNGEFYDFYCPESYFDSSKSKEAVSERNYINIYHHNDPKNYYDIGFEVNDIDITYIYSSDIDDYNLSEYEQINNNYDIYCQSFDGFIDLIYIDEYVLDVRFMFDNISSINIGEIQGSDNKQNQLISIGENILVDSIKLNNMTVETTN